VIHSCDLLTNIILTLKNFLGSNTFAYLRSIVSDLQKLKALTEGMINKQLQLGLLLMFKGGVPFHQNGFSSNGLFIKSTTVSNFQNCKQNFCSTSASKVIDDLGGVTL
jgi:hypothetical protein